MGSNYYTDPAAFLIQTITGLYLMAVMLRFILQTVRGDFHNPIGQFLITVPNPLLLPLRRVVPVWRRLDLASLVLILLLQIAALLLIAVIHGAIPPARTLLALTLFELLSLLFNLYFVTILIEVILSWIGQNNHPVRRVLWQINAPLLSPLRRLLPAISGIDLSPLLAILAIQLAKMVVLPPLLHLL